MGLSREMVQQESVLWYVSRYFEKHIWLFSGFSCTSSTFNVTYHTLAPLWDITG